MTPQIRKPPEQGGASGFQNISRRRHFTKTPPYGKQLNLNGQNLIVCTGSGAWDRAESYTWFSRCKVVLPFGNDPVAYTWSAAAGHDVLIAGFGNLEQIGTIAKLAGLLLAAGAGLVLYAPEHAPMMRINPIHKEAA